MCNTTGEYIEKMRSRHPRLSMRQMSLEAGLSGNIISQLVRGETSVKPATLKQIVDRWGTPEDYRELMRLAGHPVPEPELTEDEKRILEQYRAGKLRLESTSDLSPELAQALQNEIVQDIALRASEMDEEVLKTLQEMVRHVARLQGLDVGDEQGQD